MNHRNYTIATQAGEVVTHRVSQPELNRLLGYTDEGRAPYRDERTDEPILGPVLIYKHRKRERLYILKPGVDASVIHAELKRKVQGSFPVAEGNRTVRRENFSNERGAGVYFELVEHTCFNYSTTPKSIAEHTARIILRNQKDAEAKRAAEFFPKAA